MTNLVSGLINTSQKPARPAAGIHENVSRGEDRPVESPTDYETGPARFYMSGEKVAVPVTNT